MTEDRYSLFLYKFTFFTVNPICRTHLLRVVIAYTSPVWRSIHACNSPRYSSGFNSIARRMKRSSAAYKKKIISTTNCSLSKKAFISEDSFFAALPDIFRFCDFLLTRSLTVPVISYNRIIFFTKVLLTESVSAISYCERPRCLNIMTLHLSGLGKAFVIFQSKQQEPNMLKSQTDLQNAGKTMETVDWRPPKFGFLSREKIARGRVLVVTAVTQSCYPPAPNHLYFKTIWEGVYSQFLQGNEINRRLVSSVRRAPVSGAGGRGF